MSTEADLLPRLEQACDHLVQDSAATNWGVLIDEDNVKVFHLKDSKPDRLMGQIVVSGDIESVLHDLYDFEARRKWDTTLSEKSHVVESLSDDTSVVYMYIPGQMSVSAREMLNGRRRRALPDGAGYVVAHNKIEWASKPVTKDIVRASNTDTGYVIKKIDDKTVSISWVLQTEIGGWVGFINVRNIASQNLAKMLKAFRTYRAGK